MIRFLALVAAMALGGAVMAQATKPMPDKTPEKTPEKKDDKPIDDLQKFPGTWVVTSLTRDGRSDDNKLKELGLKVVITKDRELRYQANGKDVARATFRNEGPGLITTTSVKGHEEQGIYEFKNNDELELCIAPPGRDRPAKDQVTAGYTYITLKREKETPTKTGDEKKDPKVPDEKKDPKVPDEKKDPKP
jgi:uncharacterized protein (TIGR03067 family)